MRMDIKWICISGMTGLLIFHNRFSGRRKKNAVNSSLPIGKGVFYFFDSFVKIGRKLREKNAVGKNV